MASARKTIRLAGAAALALALTAAPGLGVPGKAIAVGPPYASADTTGACTTLLPVITCEGGVTADAESGAVAGDLSVAGPSGVGPGIGSHTGTATITGTYEITRPLRTLGLTVVINVDEAVAEAPLAATLLDNDFTGYAAVQYRFVADVLGCQFATCHAEKANNIVDTRAMRTMRGPQDDLETDLVLTGENAQPIAPGTVTFTLEILWDANLGNELIDAAGARAMFEGSLHVFAAELPA